MELERRLADVQADRSRRRLPERLRGQRRHRRRDPHERRRHHLGRAEPRQHHRRLPAEPRRHQGVPAQGRRRRAQDPARTLPAAQRKLLITDGVFSMDGDLGALPELCALAEEYGCIMMVDDAHASGVFGKNGRGTIDHFGMHGRVDIQVGTLSKAIGALGGYVAGHTHADRVPVSPRAAVPVLDVASAVGRRDVPGGARHPRRRAADHRPALGEHAVLQGRPQRARLQHRAEREPDHAGHRRRRRAAR